jgi:hypothetical protein
LRISSCRGAACVSPALGRIAYVPVYEVTCLLTCRVILSGDDDSAKEYGSKSPHATVSHGTDMGTGSFKVRPTFGTMPELCAFTWLLELSDGRAWHTYCRTVDDCSLCNGLQGEKKPSLWTKLKQIIKS